MKKLYFIIGLLAMGTASIAQNLTPLNQSPAKRTLTKAEVSPMAITHQNEKPVAETGDRVVVLNENFQGVALGNTPAAIPNGWATSIATDASSNSIPAFKVYNSTLANAGGYWPVPQVGTGNKFAGVDDDPAPCDCDFLDAWLQTPTMTLAEYSYTTTPTTVYEYTYDTTYVIASIDTVWTVDTLVTENTVTSVVNSLYSYGNVDITIGGSPDGILGMADEAAMDGVVWDSLTVSFGYSTTGLDAFVSHLGIFMTDNNANTFVVGGEQNAGTGTFNSYWTTFPATGTPGNYSETHMIPAGFGDTGFSAVLMNDYSLSDGLTSYTNVNLEFFGTSSSTTYDTTFTNVIASIDTTWSEVVNVDSIATIVNVIDSTFIGNYTLGFDFFHDQNFGGGEATVQVSNDNGTSWTIIDTLAVDGSYWQSLVLPLYAYNGQDIAVRFQWSDNGAWASGFAVDNVVVQSALTTDMSLAKVIASDWNNATFGQGFWEYSQVPVNQTTPVRATAVVYNAGFDNQLGVNVDFNIDFNGTSQGTFSTTALDCISLDKDTLSAVSTWTPSALGTVTVSGHVNTFDADQNLLNNDGAASIEITQYVYARDLNSAQAFVNPGSAYEYGNLFDIYANDDFGAIDVAVNFAAADEGSLVQGKIYEFTGLDATTGGPTLTDLGIATAEYAVTAADNVSAGMNTMIHLVFDEPVSLEAGKTYLVTMISDGSVRTPVSGNNDWVVSWMNDGTSWGATGGIPMIRLNSDETLAVSERTSAQSNVVVSQNMPNPSNGSTQINYALPQSARVNVIVRDMTGREVMVVEEGMKAAGKYSVTLNTDNLSSGIYTYTLVAGDVKVTKEMMVK